jgi:putative ABC transport system permease protein
MKSILLNLGLALDAVFVNKLRAILTALGILFGVAAVIAMLAIGNGAKRAILDQMRLIGTNNIVIKSLSTSTTSDKDKSEDAASASTNKSTSKAGEKKKSPWSPGLTLHDLQAMRASIPHVVHTSPEFNLNTTMMYNDRAQPVTCIGVTNEFFALNNLNLDEGNFFSYVHLEEAYPVCIIGRYLKTRFFQNQSPIGKTIKIGNVWLTIVGVLNKRAAQGESLKNLGIRDYNNDVFIPIQSALVRIQDRSAINKKDIGDRQEENVIVENHNQLDRAVIQVSQTSELRSTAEFIGRMLKRRHRDQTDYEIEIPELLIQQQQKTQGTFNLVLAVIAAISLLVGGIGIMNIMLASVLERIKEIGLRRSLGAKKNDITQQFLFEAIIISFIGGLAGIILGIIAARSIASYAQIPTVISSWSILMAFGVAFCIGLIFGLFPAQKAAEQDPIKSLRVE